VARWAGPAPVNHPPPASGTGPHMPPDACMHAHRAAMQTGTWTPYNICNKQMCLSERCTGACTGACTSAGCYHCSNL